MRQVEGVRWKQVRQVETGIGGETGGEMWRSDRWRQVRQVEGDWWRSDRWRETGGGQTGGGRWRGVEVRRVCVCVR